MHCNAAAGTVFCALSSLNRESKCFDEEMFRVLYITYVSIHLVVLRILNHMSIFSVWDTKLVVFLNSITKSS